MQNPNLLVLAAGLGLTLLLAPPVHAEPVPASPAAIRAFDPQPDPPGQHGLLLPAVQRGADGSVRTVSPQPSPPGGLPAAPGTLQGFNPQPEPPKGLTR